MNEPKPYKAVGGRRLEKNKHWDKKKKGSQGRSTKSKIIVAGVIERGGELRAKMLDSVTIAVLGQYINDNVKEGSVVNTDEWKGYNKLHKLFDHRVIKHNVHEYVRGDVHTNTIEGFWALLKRGIKGVYHVMSRKHIQMYIDEYVFRYNTRDFSEEHRFNMVLDKSAVRLTYKDLVN